jgi:hypothetical protein
MISNHALPSFDGSAVCSMLHILIIVYDEDFSHRLQPAHATSPGSLSNMS